MRTGCEAVSYRAAEDLMEDLLRSAASILNKAFGDEYAKKNPALVADLARLGAEAYFLNQKLSKPVAA